MGHLDFSMNSVSMVSFSGLASIAYLNVITLPQTLPRLRLPGTLQRWLRKTEYTSTIWRLPTELIVRVISLLESTDQLAVMRTCRRMRSFGEHCLYKHITIPTHRKRRIIQLLRTFKQRPDLARTTVSFAGSLFPSLGKARMSNHPTPSWLLTKRRWIRRRQIAEEDAYIELLGGSLTHMRNIKDLTLFDFDWLWTGGHDLATTWLVPHALTSLTLTGPGFLGGRWVVGYEIVLFDIIGRHPGLERLELHGGYWDLHQFIKPGDLLNLRHLAAPIQAAQCIIPRRSIQSLYLVNICKTPDKEQWRDLLSGTQPLNEFSFSATRPTLVKEMIPDVVANLPKVEVLSISGFSEADIEMVRCHLSSQFSFTRPKSGCHSGTQRRDVRVVP